MSNSNYLSVIDYAKNQGISKQAVYNRKSKGKLKFIIEHGVILIEANSYSPGKVGRPKKAKYELRRDI